MFNAENYKILYSRTSNPMISWSSGLNTILYFAHKIPVQFVSVILYLLQVKRIAFSPYILFAREREKKSASKLVRIKTRLPEIKFEMKVAFFFLCFLSSFCAVWNAKIRYIANRYHFTKRKKLDITSFASEL